MTVTKFDATADKLRDIFGIYISAEIDSVHIYFGEKDKLNNWERQFEYSEENIAKARQYVVDHRTRHLQKEISRYQHYINQSNKPKHKIRAFFSKKHKKLVEEVREKHQTRIAKLTHEINRLNAEDIPVVDYTNGDHVLAKGMMKPGSVLYKVRTREGIIVEEYKVTGYRVYGSILPSDGQIEFTYVLQRNSPDYEREEYISSKNVSENGDIRSNSTNWFTSKSKMIAFSKGIHTRTEKDLSVILEQYQKY